MKIIFGDLLHFLKRPQGLNDSSSYEYFHNGALLINDQGRIEYIGDSKAIKVSADWQVHDWRGRLIVPGFVDCHIHYAQTDIIGSFGEQLLDWLNLYTFPEERRFADRHHADEVAEVFFNQLLSNGTTTAGVFPTMHANSVEAFFAAAERRNMRMVCGKVLMDRNCPEWLSDNTAEVEKLTRDLIEEWHGRGRLHYALTPRFAPTSTPDQLQMVGRLFKEYPGLYLQSHLAENRDEVKWVRSLFPEARSYLDVYDRFGLLGERAVYAHCIYLEDEDWKRLSESQTTIAFSPSSNLFLGSGLFNLAQARANAVKVGLATDVGAGTSFSMLKTMGEAYKVLQLQNQKFNPLEAFYMATLGGANALSLESMIGNFKPGKEADFVVLNERSSDLLKRRQSREQSLMERLFSLIMLSNDQVVASTYIAGEPAYKVTGL